jgi:predicted ATPase
MMEWVYKGNNSGPTRLEVVANTGSRLPLRHSLELGLEQARFVVVSEAVAFSQKLEGKRKPYFFYEYENGTATLNKFDRPNERHLETKFVGDQQSILNALKDPISYPELSYLSKAYTDQIRIYREWSMGRYSAPRLPQPADFSGEFLDEDFRNLGMVINQLEQDHPDISQRMVEVLQTLYPSITGIGVQIVGGTQQVYLREGKIKIPATRLSDGTLRFLCLLTILLHPIPPKLVCIEEPELGLHPDVIGTLAELLIEASERTQLIVTTHSVRLIDGLSDCPESVVVCEKDENGTRMERLSAKELEPWLSEYRLGKLWTRGEIGGNRW